MSRLALPALLLWLATSIGCGLADLRPESLETPLLSSDRVQRGRRLLADAAQAHGVSAWKTRRWAEVTFRDHWQGLIGRLFCPWPDLEIHARARYLLGSTTSDCELLDGSQRGALWGVQDDRERAWVRSPGGGARRDSEAPRFILPTYQFFFELPFTIGTADVVAAVGTERLDGRECDLVFVTWGSARPHREHDQFLLWIDRETHRIRQAQYTIRAKTDWATGCNRFSDLREVDAVWIPFRYTITLEPGDDAFVHQVSLEWVRFDVAPPSTREP